MQVALTTTKLKPKRAVAANTRLAICFSLNVYSSSKHTNCNFPRVQMTESPIPFAHMSTKKAFRFGAIHLERTLSSRTPFLASVLVSGLSSRHRRFLTSNFPEAPFEFVSSKPRAPRPSPESARFLSCRPQTKNKGSLPLVSLTSRLLPHPHVRILDPHRKFVSSAIKAVRLCPFPRITLTNEFTIKEPEQMLPG